MKSNKWYRRRNKAYLKYQDIINEFAGYIDDCMYLAAKDNLTELNSPTTKGS